MTRLILSVLLSGLFAGSSSPAAEDTKKPAGIQWKPYDCSAPLLLPEAQYEVSQFGKGQYRVDGTMSQGHFNNIYLVFQAGSKLEPAVVPGASESKFPIKGQKVTWRSYKTVVEGRPVIRKEALLLNRLPRQRQDNASDCIWVRIDADTQAILDRLTPVAEGILRDASLPAPLPVDVEGAARTLMEVVRQTKDPDAKWLAVRAIGELRYNCAVPLLIECLKDDHHYVRANAARALGDMAAMAAAAALIDLLKSEKDGGVLEQTSLALVSLQAHEAVPVLKLHTTHPSVQTRCWMLRAIGQLGSRTDVPFLAERLNAEIVSEQCVAAQAIESLANVDFEFPEGDGFHDFNPAIGRAKEWWQKHQSAFATEKK